MNLNPHTSTRISVLLLVLILIGCVAAPTAAAAGTPVSPEQAVRRAWEAARDVGAYQFTSDLVQTTRPVPALSSVGRSSTRNALHLEGTVDLPARTLEMRLWTNGGSVVSPETAAEIRIQGQQGWMRQAGGSWQEDEDFAGGFAPNGDFLSYLSGIKNVRETSSPQRAPGVSRLVTSFQFDFDGPAFARHTRDQLEQILREQGELPSGVYLDTSNAYRATTGAGEISLDDRGLPQHLSMHLVYPPDDRNQRTEADIDISFVFARTESAAMNTAPGGMMGSLTTWLHDSRGTDFPQQTLLLALAILCCLAIVVARRSPRAYRIVVVSVIVSMIVIPLLQAQQVSAFFERQAEKDSAAQAGRDDEETSVSVREEMMGVWDPHRDPLAALAAAPQEKSGDAILPILAPGAAHPLDEPQAPSLDTDGDGLTDAIEIAVGADPLNPDSDGDGLDDGVEARLKISLWTQDSDNDGIWDNVEVLGFTDAAGRRWYPDPASPDTNGDGISDGVECAVLTGAQPGYDPNAVVECDADADGLPDPFDFDDDADAVPDTVDLTQGSSMGKDGLTYDPGNPQPFDADGPLQLTINNLGDRKPVLVDFQLRTEDAQHLTYAMNVMDWPSTDQDGQIQHVKGTTFSQGRPGQVEYDPRLDDGDVRLIPMLEITLPAGDVPLPLTRPTIEIVADSAISVTIQLSQNADDAARTDLAFDFEDATGSYSVNLYEGACPADGEPLLASDLVAADGNAFTLDAAVGRATELADGEHVIHIEGGGKIACEPLGNITNGTYDDKMIDAEPLDPYGISVREKDQAGTLLAYVPMNIVTDPTGGANVAFQARMYYQTDSEKDMVWSSAQQVRVMWLVQMLTDECDPTDFEPSAAAQEPAEGYEAQYAKERTEWCSEHRTGDVSRIVQTYDESWYLTGLMVRQDLGMDVAIIWEDPATDNDHNADDRLWQAARGLLTAFVSGRDEDSNGQLDLGINARNGADGTIGDRLDAEGSVPDGDVKRWGIPRDALQVRSFEYPHEDYVGQIASQDARAILAEAFESHNPITPTLLFAREETAIGLDLTAITGVVNDVVTLDFDGHTSITLAQVSWAPYRYNDTLGPDRQPIGWERYPAALYWDKLEAQFTAAFRNLPEEVNPYRDDEYAVIGQMLSARSLYFTIAAGITGLVQTGSANEGLQFDVVVPYSVEGSMDSDAAIAAGALGMFNNVFGIVMSFTGDFIGEVASSVAAAATAVAAAAGQTATAVAAGAGSQSSAATKWLFQTQGKGFQGIKDSWVGCVTDLKGLFVNASSQRGGYGTSVGTAIVLVAGLLAIGACIAAAATADNALAAVGWAVSAIAMVLQVKGVIDGIAKWVKAASAATTAAASVSGAVSQASKLTQMAHFLGKTFSSTANKLALAGAIVSAVITWAVFAVQAGLMDLTYQQMGNLVARTIAQTIVLVIMFVISLIPIVGGIITGIIGIIDGLIGAICAIFGWDEEQEGDTNPYNDAGDWLCGGIQGLVSTFLAWFIYAGNEIVDMGAEDRLQFDDLNAHHLHDPDRGLTTGNLLDVGVVLTNTLTMMGRPGNVGGGYYWQFKEHFPSSTFSYQMQTEETDIHDDLGRWAMEDEWQEVPEGQSGDIYIHQVVPEVPVTLPPAGINRELQVYLSEGYNIPVQNCYLGVCVVDDDKDTIHYPLTNTLVFDILPATLDEFYSRSWGQDYSIGRVMMQDADGDGLAANIDPNDAYQDTDGDGLVDPRELQFGSSATLTDTDGDGINDYEEIRLNTDPTRKDTDGDGLWDGQEVYHQDKGDEDLDDDRIEWVGGWRYVYRINAAGQQESAWVTSDPEKVDTDDDGLIDRDEHLYGFNPNVWSNARVLSLASQFQEPTGAGGYEPTDNVVQPGSTLYYTATLTNELLSRYMQGLLSGQFPAADDPAALAPVSFILQPTEAQTLDGELGVSASAASGVYSATLVASALIADWTVLAEGARLWLAMDDPVTADRSGSFPPNDAICTGTCASITGGPYGNALLLDGASYLSSPADASETAYGVSLWFKTEHAAGALFAATGDDGAEVYLSAGHVCATVRREGVAETACSTGTDYADSQWHHVVHAFGGDTANQRLYVDGELAAAGTAMGLPHASAGGVQIGRNAFSGAALYSGMIDDVRLYNTALSAHQARLLFRQPVLAMTFENPIATATGTQWTDASAFVNQGACTSNQCPSEVAGVQGQGLQFDGQNRHVDIAEDPSLDLSEGHFTIALWLKPETGRTDAAYCGDFEWQGQNCGWWQPEGILGLKSGTEDAYVSLQRMVVRGGANTIRFGFAAASESGEPTWAGYYTTPAIGLTDNAWNHLALSYGGGEVRVYLNGELVASDETTFKDATTGAFKTPAAARRFEIGRTTDAGAVHFSSFDAWDEDDSGDAELCIACTGQAVYSGSVSGDNTYAINAVCPFTDETYWQIWEDDEGTTCGTARDGDDDFITGAWFRLTDPATPGHDDYAAPCLLNMPCLTMPDDANVTGVLNHNYTKESLPFRGTLDELLIYRAVLDPAEVRQIFLSTNTALNLALDDAPGATSFADASTGSHDATCTGDACPTAGVGGRDVRAALFKTAEQDHLIVSDFGDLEQATVSAWVYRTQSTAARATIISAQEGAGCGIALALNDDGASQYPMFSAWIADGDENALHKVEFAEAVPLNTWVHLAGVYDGAQLRLYRNGTEVATTAAPGALKQCTGDTAIGSHADSSQHFFGGRIDAVRVYVRGLTAAEVLDVYSEAPVLHLRLDEPYGATQFADNAATTRTMALAPATIARPPATASRAS